MGGLFGAISKQDCVLDIFFGADYHSHLGTRRGGIAIYNSAYYEKVLLEIEYIDFGNGNVVNYAQFCTDQYLNEENSFVFPGSAFTIEFLNTFNADHVVICVKTDNAAALNEIVVLGK